MEILFLRNEREYHETPGRNRFLQFVPFDGTQLHHDSVESSWACGTHRWYGNVAASSILLVGRSDRRMIWTTFFNQWRSFFNESKSHDAVI